MSKRKRKGKRQTAARRAETGSKRPAQREDERRLARPESKKDVAGSQDGRAATRQRAGERAQPAVVYPPLPLSLARGMRAVGTSPALLVTTFLGALALWLAYTAYGVDLAASPYGMILLESLPPFQSFLDVQILAAGRPASRSVVIGLGLAVMAARALLVAVWVTLILRSLQAELAGPAEATPWSNRRGIRKYPVMLGIQAVFLMMMFVALAVAPGFLGAEFGQLGVIVALLAGTYFFVFAPVIAVTEGVALREAFRLSIRAARVPGPRHMVLTFSYVAFSLFILATAPVSPDLTATPSILVWLYALFVAFLHVSVLAALTFRWLFVRDHVLQGPTAARSGGGR